MKHLLTFSALAVLAILPVSARAQSAPRIGTFAPSGESGCSPAYWLARGGSYRSIVLDAMEKRMRLNGQMVALQDVSDNYNERTRRSITIYTVPSLGARVVPRAHSRSTGEESSASLGTLAVSVRSHTTTVRVRGEGGC